MAQMFLPNLAELGLQIGEPPVRLPQDLFPVPGVVAFAAMSSEAIGISIGDGEEAGLPDWLEARRGPEGMFLSLNYDTAAYLDLTEQFAGDRDIYQKDTGGVNDAAMGPHAVAAAARQAFREMADRSETTMSFAPGGLVIDGRMTFQPLP
jgi:hypothetical protein